MRITRIVVASVVLSTALDGQSRGQSGTLTFDVASIRPLENAKPYAIGPPVNGAVRARGIDVRRLVQYAYGVEPLDRNPIPEGGPEWIDRDLYEVVGQGPADLSFPDARRMMLTLLQERFTLKSHIERRELPV